MFRIRPFDARLAQDAMALSAILRIYQEAFPHYPGYAAKIADVLREGETADIDILALIAEGAKNRVLGFALAFLFRDPPYAYLDYIASMPARSKRGFGGALYEEMREHLVRRGYKGLLMDVPPDDPAKLKAEDRLRVNKRRLAFYEQFGARPLEGTLYDSVSTKANKGHYTYLVFDDLATGEPLRRRTLKALIRRILLIKGKMGPDDSKLKKIVDSVHDDPVRLRAPHYAPKNQGVIAGLKPLDLVSSGDAHQIHHLKEKGYVQRPARVHAISRGLTGTIPFHEFKVRHFAEHHITAVHSPRLVRFIKEAATRLQPNQLVYPNVFPVRRPDRVPRTWEMRAGYYCIDTFTPVTANAYRAARRAVDAALTGAERILKGSQHCYVVCRPPGHHAERDAFGGFCYFNNAAIAAHHLSNHGTVAFIDIDYHHGNGSQQIFYERSDVLFVSLHGHPRVSYPYFAGFSEERGDGPGQGFNRNYPMYPGANDVRYTTTLARALGRIRRFRPSYLVISLGFDIMAGDPTGQFVITEQGVERIGNMLGGLGVPTLVVQEGGYSLRNLRVGAPAFFRGLLA